MEVKKNIYKAFSIIFIFTICIMANLFFNKAFAINLSSNYYKIDSNNKIISRLGPKTSVEIFKKATNIQSGELKVYKDTSLREEVTTGYIGTGMVATDENKTDIYQISVVGDLDGDGNASQVELTYIIRNLTGLKGYDLDGIKKISADINGDENVNQIDITKYINYLVYGELDLKRPEPDFDLVAPEVNVTLQNKTTNTITVKVSATDDKDMPDPFVYVYYIKETTQPDSEYQHKKSGTEDTFTFTRLKMNTNYTIKVETTDAAGNKGFKELTVKTDGNGNVLDGTVQISQPVWSDGKASVTVTTDTEYDIEYQINGGEWVKLPEGQNTINNLNNGDVVNVRVTDGINVGNYTTITIQDAVPPTVNLELGTPTTSKIQATASNAKDEQTGIETPVTYKFYIKKASENDSSYQLKETSTSSTYTFTGLLQNTDYTVKVEVTDKAGNVGKAEKTAKTKTLPSLNDVIEVEDPVWNDGEASIEIKVDRDKLDEDNKVLVKVNDGDWTELPEGQDTIPGLKDGDEVHIKVTDGTNESEEIVVIVKDKVPPIVSLEVGTVTLSSIQVTAQARDEQSGISDTATYKFSIKEANQDDSAYQEKQNTTSKTCNFEGLTRDKTYTIKVEVSDIAGNIGSAKKDVSTSGIPNGNEDGAIIFEETMWSNGKASVVVKTETNYQIEYQINSKTGEWTKVPRTQDRETLTNLNNRDVIYARLTDGTNSGGDTSKTIKDSIEPKAYLQIEETTSSTIKATASATDSQTGISDTAIYNFYIKKTNQGNESYELKQNTTSKICTFTELEQNTGYTIKVEVSDMAGNPGSTTSTATTEKIPKGEGDETTEGAIQFETPTWNNEKASVVVKTKTNYQIEYQINKITGTWTKVPKGQNRDAISELNNGDVIYARLTDGTNSGEFATTTILDNKKPETEISLTAMKEEIGNTINATVTHIDQESGININQCKWVYNTTSTEIGADPNSYTGGTFNSNPQTINLVANAEGTYYLHVLTIDKAGNKKEEISDPIQIIPLSTIDRSGLKVGDYINYIPDTASDYTELTVYNTGSSNNSAIPQETLNWQILRIYDDGKMDLIGSPTTSQIYFKSSIGYNNGVYFMNDICKSLYSKNSKGIIARNINMEDVDFWLTDSGKNYKNEYKSNMGAKYGQTQTISTAVWSSGTRRPPTYPNIYAYEKDSNIDGNKNTNGLERSTEGGSGFDVPFVDSSIYGYGSETKANSYITVKDTAYSIPIDRGSYFGEGKKALNTDNKYWIASRSLSSYISSNQTKYCANFGLFCKDDTNISYETMLITGGDGGGNAVGDANMGLRPIVTLTSNIKVRLSTGENSITNMHEIQY